MQTWRTMSEGLARGPRAPRVPPPRLRIGGVIAHRLVEPKAPPAVHAVQHTLAAAGKSITSPKGVQARGMRP